MGLQRINKLDWLSKVDLAFSIRFNCQGFKLKSPKYLAIIGRFFKN
jgi:hypothetical protein